MKEKEEIILLLKAFEEKLQKPENHWLLIELRKMIDNIDIKDIRSVLNISGYHSVDYSFIADVNLRKQLMIDNYRMEDTALNTRINDEIERFYNYCVNTFYQIENLVNYYFYYHYKNLDDCFKHFEETQVNCERLKYMSTIADIPIGTKLYSFGKDVLGKEYGYKLQRLREVRNEGLHRCTIIVKDNKDNNKINVFFKNEDFNSIRILLKKIVSCVKVSLSKNSG